MQSKEEDIHSTSEEDSSSEDHDDSEVTDSDQEESSSSDSDGYTEEELRALADSLEGDGARFLEMLEERKRLYELSPTPCQAKSKNGLIILYDLDLPIVDSDNTSLILAAESNLVSIARGLLAQGANPNIEGGLEFTALHAAAREGHSEVVQLLLESGANWNVQNIYGDTVLHCAALSGSMVIVKMLVERGASLEVQNKEGKTPLDYIPKEYRETVKTLQQQCFGLVLSSNFAPRGKLWRSAPVLPQADRQTQGLPLPIRDTVDEVQFSHISISSNQNN